MQQTSQSKCTNNEKITFIDRKKGKICDLYTNIWEENKDVYRSNKTFQKSGRIFNASETNSKNDKIFHISGRYLTDPLYKKYTIYTTPTTATTYIYIISKLIDNKIYFKVGEGGKGESRGTGRLGDAQTYLIPGLEEESGYNVHFVFFFRKNLHNNSKYIGQQIEQQIHSVLQKYFKPINISYPNGEASEWYLLQTTSEQLFFIGFVFDIIGCYDHEKTKPLEIWKYSKTTPVRSKVSIPTGVIKRMRLDNTYKTIESKLIEFNLRKKQRPIGMIIDKNDTLKYNEQLSELRQFFNFSARDNIRNKPYSLVFDNIYVQLVDFKIHSASHQLEKYSKYYVVLEPRLGTTKENLQEFFEKKGKKTQEIYITNSIQVLLGLKDFLELYKTYYIKEPSQWPLNHIYEFYQSSQYEKNIEVIASPSSQIPSWYSQTAVQMHWAQKMTNDKEWKYHEDTSVSDDDTVTLRKWEVHGYDDEDGVRLKRFQLDSNNQKIDNTEEEVSVLRIMKIKNVYKPEH